LGTDCDYPFREGKRYLVYSHRRDNNALYQTLCSGTRLTTEAKADLDYWRTGRLEPGTLLMGKVTRRTNERGRNLEMPIPYAKVHLVSANLQVEATADKNGNFVLHRIPAGRYRVHTIPITNNSSLVEDEDYTRTEWDIKAADHGCQTIWFAAMPGAGVH
jgi:hypothetical protein